MVNYWLDQFIKYSFIALFAFPILPLNIAASVLIGCGVFVLTDLVLRWNKKEYNFKFKLPSLFLCIIGLCYAVNLFYAQNNDVVWSEFEKRLGLIVIPLMFFLAGKEHVQYNRRWFAWSFIIATSVLSCTWVSIHLFGVADNIIENPSIPYFYKLRTVFEEYTHVHPSYYGLFAGATILLNLQQCIESKNKWLYTLVVLNVVALFLSGARMALLATILSSIILLLVQKKFRILLGVVGIVFVGLFASKDVLLPRLQNILKTVSNQADESARGTDLRKDILYCSKILIESHGLKGLGSDGVQAALNMCYFSAQKKDALEKNLNTHNEYLNLILTFGITGLCLLILYIGALLRIGIKYPIVLALAILIALQLLTENVLARQQGIFFIALITALFSYPINKEIKL